MRHHYFFLLRELVKRDFKSRYAGSLFGFLWSFVMPLWQLLLFTFVFSKVMRVSPFGERTGSFGIFLFCGLLPWMAVQEGILRAATAITDNANLVKKVSFPAHVLVLTVVLGALLHEAIAAVVFAGVLGWLEQISWSTLPVLLLAVPLQIALTMGLGLLLCSVHVFVRDTAQVVGMVLLGWFFLTPIVYPLAQVPEPYRALIELNPLTALVSLYRLAFLGGELDLGSTAALAVEAVVLLVFGAWLFRRLKPAFVDEL